MERSVAPAPADLPWSPYDRIAQVLAPEADDATSSVDLADLPTARLSALRSEAGERGDGALVATIDSVLSSRF